MTALDHDISVAPAAAAAPEGRLAQAWSEFAESRIAVGALAVVAALVDLELVLV